MRKKYPRRLTILLPIPLIDMVKEWAIGRGKSMLGAYRSLLMGRMVRFYRDKDYDGSFLIREDGYEKLTGIDAALKKRESKKVLIDLPTVVHKFVRSRAQQTGNTVTNYVMRAFIQELVPLH